MAQRAGIDARYAREWLEQQASTGYVDVTAPSDQGDTRRYGLSPAAQECLLRPESLASLGPPFDVLPALNRVFPAKLAQAFRTGGGIAYLHDAQGDANRPVYTKLLAGDWLAKIPGLAQRLSLSGARVAQIGCGAGWAAIAIAQAFPEVRIDGLDNDEAPIATARMHAVNAGVGDRAKFEVADVAGMLPDQIVAGSYDLVLALAMIHDLARPVEALATMRRLGKPDAVHLVLDENVAEVFQAATENPAERLQYAVSVLHCLPVGRSESPSAATGTVMRPATLAAYATAAGFAPRRYPGHRARHVPLLPAHSLTECRSVAPKCPQELTPRVRVRSCSR